MFIQSYIFSFYLMFGGSESEFSCYFLFIVICIFYSLGGSYIVRLILFVYNIFWKKGENYQELAYRRI